MALLPNRSPRFQKASLVRSREPGPGAYLGSFPRGPAESVRGGAVPLANRVPITRWGTRLVTPGPGTYNLRGADPGPGAEAQPFTTDPMGLSSTSFRSTRSRISTDNLKEPMLVPGSTEFQPAKSADNPGPGQYEARGQLSKRSWSYPPPFEPPLMRAKTAPSFLPLKKDIRYSGNSDGIPAPVEYEHEKAHQSMKSTLREDGPSVDFHTSSSKRVAFRPVEDSPGPGAYRTPDLPAKGTSLPFTSQTRRSPVEIEYLTKTPGPETRFEPEAESPEKAVAFSSNRSLVQREGLHYNAKLPFSQPDNMKVPGPGQYADPSSCFQGGRRHRARPSVAPGLEASRKRFHGVHTPKMNATLLESDAAVNTPFSSTQARPVLIPDLRRVQSDVGQYNSTESLGQSMSATLLKEQARVGKGGVFGVTRNSERFCRSVVLAEAESAPAPGHHQPDGVGFRVQRSSPAGVAFKSATPQCWEPRSGPRPGPGAYEFMAELGSAPKAKLSKSRAKQFSAPRTEHVSFGSSAGRFSGPEFKDAEERPAVGEYSPSPPPRLSRGASKVTSKCPTLEPLKAAPTGQDPGTYQAEASGNTLLRRSFNVAADPEVAKRRSQRRRSEPAPPAVGGGAGGGAAGMRTRLAMSLGNFSHQRL